jgi:hypothetical protein
VPPITGVVRDPNDDMVIACAVQARADHIGRETKIYCRLDRIKKPLLFSQKTSE